MTLVTYLLQVAQGQGTREPSYVISPGKGLPEPAPKMTTMTSTGAEGGLLAALGKMFGATESGEKMPTTASPSSSKAANDESGLVLRLNTQSTMPSKGTTAAKDASMTPEVAANIRSILAGPLVIGRRDLKRGKRPKPISLTPGCKREYDFRHYEFPRLAPVFELGYGDKPQEASKEAPSKSPTSNDTSTKITVKIQETMVSTPDDIDAAIRRGDMYKANISVLERTDIQLLNKCDKMSLPQFVYLIMSKKLQYLDDSCISSISPSLFTALTPALAEDFFVQKPGYLVLFWRYFKPAVKAALPCVDKYILRERSKSFLCCSLDPDDFSHFDRLYSASRDCLLNLFPPVKCSQIPPSFWKPGPFELNNTTVPVIEVSRLKTLVPIDKLPELPPLSKEFSSAVDQKLLFSHILDHISLECFDALTTESRIALWAQLDAYSIKSGEIYNGRSRQVAEEMRQHHETTKKYGASVPKSKSSSAMAYPMTNLLSLLSSLSFLI